MKKETLYLDTSVLSAYYDQRAKERREDTIRFWKEILPDYEVYISDLAIEEIQATKDMDLRRRLRSLVRSFKILKTTTAIRKLARAYLERGVFPEKYMDDALHVAIASYNKMSYLLSWNFEHLVKVRTRRLVNLVNALEGMGRIEIISPLEL